MPTDEVIAALGEQHDELGGLLDRLAPPDWDRATRCDGWTVGDVVLHLAQTDELAVASLEDRLAAEIAARTGGATGLADVDDGAAAMVAAERGGGADDIHRRWRQASREVRATLDATDGRRRVRWVAGELSARTLAATRLAEGWIHTGDVADAVGVELAPAPRLRHVARLAWRTLPYAFARAGSRLTGPVAFELWGPDGASWSFVPDAPAATIIRGDGVELCLVAGRRLPAAASSLSGEGPDAAAVLELVRTYA